MQESSENVRRKCPHLNQYLLGENFQNDCSLGRIATLLPTNSHTSAHLQEVLLRSNKAKKKKKAIKLSYIIKT